MEITAEKVREGDKGSYWIQSGKSSYLLRNDVAGGIVPESSGKYDVFYEQKTSKTGKAYNLITKISGAGGLADMPDPKKNNDKREENIKHCVLCNNVTTLTEAWIRREETAPPPDRIIAVYKEIKDGIRNEVLDITPF